jgi:hypothetical protein
VAKGTKFQHDTSSVLNYSIEYIGRNESHLQASPDTVAADAGGKENMGDRPAAEVDDVMSSPISRAAANIGDE